MNCVACGYDPNGTVVTTYTIVLEHEAYSLNEIGTNNSRNAFAYKRARKRFEKLLTRYSNLPNATGPRRVFFTRFWGKGKRAFDYGNLVGGFKPLLDMLVKYNFLLDDKPKYCEDYYRQYKSPDGVGHIVVVIEELGQETT